MAKKPLQWETIESETIRVKGHDSPIVNIPKPTRLYVGVMNSSIFNINDTIEIQVKKDTAIISEFRKIRKKDGNVIIFNSALNNDPVIGGVLYKIVGKKETKGKIIN